MKKNEKTGLLVPLLFAVYLALLIWIILFKLEFSISVLKTNRSINLIPFYYENEIGMGFHLKEVLENAVIFIPLGIYLCMLKHDFSVKVKFIFILMTSLILEISQYILAVGRTDVTDLITNTCGGMAGVGLYWLSVKVFRNKKRLDFIITVLAAVATIVVIGLLAILLIVKSSLGNSLKMQQKNRPYKRIQQVGEKNVHFKIVQGNFPEKKGIK